jgi:hypothetical protein
MKARSGSIRRGFGAEHGGRYFRTPARRVRNCRRGIYRRDSGRRFTGGPCTAFGHWLRSPASGVRFGWRPDFRRSAFPNERGLRSDRPSLQRDLATCQFSDSNATFHARRTRQRISHYGTIQGQRRGRQDAGNCASMLRGVRVSSGLVRRARLVRLASERCRLCGLRNRPQRRCFLWLSIGGLGFPGGMA